MFNFIFTTSISLLKSPVCQVKPALLRALPTARLSATSIKLSSSAFAEPYPTANKSLPTYTSDENTQILYFAISSKDVTRHVFIQPFWWTLRNHSCLITNGTYTSVSPSTTKLLRSIPLNVLTLLNIFISNFLFSLITNSPFIIGTLVRFLPKFFTIVIL